MLCFVVEAGIITVCYCFENKFFVCNWWTCCSGAHSVANMLNKVIVMISVNFILLCAFSLIVARIMKCNFI